ncbi:MAG: hypothetical protein QOI13_1874 [Paraburkholderia sp.]|nr:hypothetical protein [Paraburkholderia sp.]
MRAFAACFQPDHAGYGVKNPCRLLMRMQIDPHNTRVERYE